MIRKFKIIGNVWKYYYRGQVTVHDERYIFKYKSSSDIEIFIMNKNEFECEITYMDTLYTVDYAKRLYGVTDIKFVKPVFNNIAEMKVWIKQFNEHNKALLELSI